MKHILTNFLFVAILLCVGLGCGRFSQTDEGGSGYTVFSLDELQKAQKALSEKIGEEGKITQILISDKSLKCSVTNPENPLLEDIYIFDANGLKTDMLGKFMGKVSSDRVYSIGDIELPKAMDFIEKAKQRLELPGGKAFRVLIYRSDFYYDKDYSTIWSVGIEYGSRGGMAYIDNDGNELKAIRDGKDIFVAKKPASKTPIQTGEDTTPSTGVPKRISQGVVNGKAIKLPKPEYPAAARAVNAKGFVNVAVVIGVKGDVISAEASSGHPLLRKPAEEAARLAEFKPASVSKQPVEVSGVIVYDFGKN